MAILGYNVKGATNVGFAAGMKLSSPFVLASAQTLQELHGWFGGAGTNVILHIYADAAGVPGTRVAYTSPLALTGVDVELSQAGFSVPLAAGTYWIGFTAQAVGTGGLIYREATGGSYKGILSGATFNPPDDPYGTTNTSNATRVLSVWAVVGTVASVPVADFTGTPLTGTVPLSVAFTDTSTNAPTSWAWTFGDGGTSSSQNPTHNYTVAGTYTVVLVATNAAGSNTKTRTGYITVSDQPRPIRINTSQGWADIGDATSFVSGAGAPTSAVGATGAIYLDTTSHRVYGPKAAGAWPSTPLGVLVPDYTGVTNGWSLKIVAGVPAWSA